MKSYPSPKQIGSREVLDLFSGPVVVQEKVDGSQFSFIRTDGAVIFRSRSGPLQSVSPQDLFAPAIAAVCTRSEDLLPGHIYRGEAVCKPRHNVLKYDRCPEGFVALFDVQRPDGAYMTPAQVTQEAARVRLGAVPVLYEGELSPDGLRKFLSVPSFLGGPSEGVVVKNYALAHRSFGDEPAAFAGKFVSERFKEAHSRPPKEPGVPIEQELIATYRTVARWDKARQHLREAGSLKGDNSDIGPMIKEVSIDFERECAEEIRDALWQRFRKDLIRGVSAGLAEWYKDRLLERE